MAPFILYQAGKQRRSEKAEKYAIDLAIELRNRTHVASAYHLAKYYTIDNLKAALAAVRQGQTLELDSPPPRHYLEQYKK